MARIQIDLNELAHFPLPELDVLKALVKLHAGQNMQQVRDDLSLDDALAQRIARFLVHGEGRHRLPLLFCDRLKGEFDQLCIDVCQAMNQILGTQYRAEDLRAYVLPWYQRGYTEMMVFRNVVEDRANAWRDDRKLKTHLRPATLFGEKFEQYVNLSRISSAGDGQVGYDDAFLGV